MNLRRRLVLWYGALLAVVLALALGLAYVLHAESHDADVDAAMNDMAARSTAEVEAQLTSGVPLTEITLGDLHRVIDEPYAAWLVVGGSVTASAGLTDNVLLSTIDPVTIDDGWRTRWTENGRIRTLGAPIASPGSRIVLAADLRAIDAANEQLRWSFVLLGILAVGVGTAAISQLTATALKPVAVLMATADEIARSRDFARRVGLTGDPEDELVALSTTFDTMLASLESAYRQQQRFLGDVSHELRTPLAVIHGNAQLLTDGRGDSAAMTESATHILRESERLARLVDKLLVLARADAAEPFAPASVHLDEVVMETFEEMRPIAGARLRVPWIDAVIVDGERDRLKQLLVVLLDNALRYTPAPGTVDLTVSDDGHDAVIRVEDQGIGLPNVPTDRLFERSYRGPGAKVVDPTGSGLGLSIARWIVARHGGSILIEPNDGGGTCVVVRLPRRERAARRPEPEEITVASEAFAPAE